LTLAPLGALPAGDHILREPPVLKVKQEFQSRDLFENFAYPGRRGEGVPASNG
jgi:hypothetical protein